MIVSRHFSFRVCFPLLQGGPSAVELVGVEMGVPQSIDVIDWAAALEQVCICPWAEIQPVQGSEVASLLGWKLESSVQSCVHCCRVSLSLHNRPCKTKDAISTFEQEELGYPLTGSLPCACY